MNIHDRGDRNVVVLLSLLNSGTLSGPLLSSIHEDNYTRNLYADFLAKERNDLIKRRARRYDVLNKHNAHSLTERLSNKITTLAAGLRLFSIEAESDVLIVILRQTHRC